VIYEREVARGDLMDFVEPCYTVAFGRGNNPRPTQGCDAFNRYGAIEVHTFGNPLPCARALGKGKGLVHAGDVEDLESHRARWDDYFSNFTHFLA
jgi:hypothetical protein